MPHRRSARFSRPVIAVLLAAILAAIVVAAVVLDGGSSHASHPAPRQFESIFQDDQLLLDSPTRTVVRTLDTMRGLGADRVRATVLWLAIAPDGASSTAPRHFDATNPHDYPAAGWAPYDRLVELAAQRGIAVDFNVTAPGPLWAMAHPAPSLKLATHYRPSGDAFGKFVSALGRRYSGSWRVGRGRRGAARIPRVSFWTIWNEPNQPGWLAPQWRAVGGLHVVDAPRLYRAYVDAAFAALQRTGHRTSTDTILIGELAPEGSETTAPETPIPPLPFIRALYCVDGTFRPLRGRLVGALHCPAGGSPSAFVNAHPGLFDASGFAHHPYSFFLSPRAPMSDANFVPLSNLGRLEHALDRIFAAYGVHRQLPIYLTEYGYETNPPNPFRGVGPRTQSTYLNEAQYLAWGDPRVRSMAQFLLVDSGPNRNFPPGSIGYWSTFQTGLEYSSHVPKPSFGAYRLPVYVPNPRLARGSSLFLWAMLRLAPNDTVQHARIQWRGPSGGYRTIASVSTSDPDGFLTVHVRPPGSGRLRVEWMAPGGEAFESRSVTVRVGS